MAAEKTLRKRICSILRRHKLDPHAIENGTELGTPDVECIAAWIELKAVDGWPKRPGTPLRVPHFTREQRVWLTRRCFRGGRALVLMRVGAREHLLFRGDVAAKFLGHATRERLVEVALAHWPDGLIEEEFIRCVCESERAT